MKKVFSPVSIRKVNATMNNCVAKGAMSEREAMQQRAWFYCMWKKRKITA